MDLIQRNGISFKAGFITSLGPIAGITWSYPSMLSVVWIAAILKIGIIVIGAGLGGMFTAFCTDFYHLKMKHKIFKNGTRQRKETDKAA